MEIIDWTYKLQLQLQEMSDQEFMEWMKGKAIKFEGKLYQLEEKKNEEIKQ